MKTSNLVIWLSSLIALLALVAASIGLFWQDGGSSFTFTTLRGDNVSIAGQGLYRYDTTLVAMGFKAGDGVTLVLGIPALIFSLLRYRRGSAKGGLLLAGTLAYFLYAYGSMAFGAAYNHLGTIQMLAGLINLGQFIGFVASFAILTLYAIWFTLALFRNVLERIFTPDDRLLDVVKN